ncbi:hypothetical protein CSUI_003861 [Cystoisospora suis]|uniref:Uncharacterized protein n=1 Tax=Cystoisospora suis TaxID=483139 RepID=A0A2C6L0X5_9APIC|nr:hypothetical protein CSUI_003861 [Cystoisospora suis]
MSLLSNKEVLYGREPLSFRFISFPSSFSSSSQARRGHLYDNRRPHLDAVGLVIRLNRFRWLLLPMKIEEKKSEEEQEDLEREEGERQREEKEDQEDELPPEKEEIREKDLHSIDDTRLERSSTDIEEKRQGKKDREEKRQKEENSYMEKETEKRREIERHPHTFSFSLSTSHTSLPWSGRLVLRILYYGKEKQRMPSQISSSSSLRSEDSSSSSLSSQEKKVSRTRSSLSSSSSDDSEKRKKKEQGDAVYIQVTAISYKPRSLKERQEQRREESSSKPLWEPTHAFLHALANELKEAISSHIRTRELRLKKFKRYSSSLLQQQEEEEEEKEEEEKEVRQMTGRQDYHVGREEEEEEERKEGEEQGVTRHCVVREEEEEKDKKEEAEEEKAVERSEGACLLDEARNEKEELGRNSKEEEEEGGAGEEEKTDKRLMKRRGETLPSHVKAMKTIYRHGVNEREDLQNEREEDPEEERRRRRTTFLSTTSSSSPPPGLLAKTVEFLESIVLSPRKEGLSSRSWRRQKITTKMRERWNGQLLKKGDRSFSQSRKKLHWRPPPQPPGGSS